MLIRSSLGVNFSMEAIGIVKTALNASPEGGSEISFFINHSEDVSVSDIYI